MTPNQEMILGELWANMARKEGHQARVPNVVPPEVKRLNQQRNRAPLTQRVINLLRERGPMQAAVCPATHVWAYGAKENRALVARPSRATGNQRRLRCNDGATKKPARTVALPTTIA